MPFSTIGSITLYERPNFETLILELRYDLVWVTCKHPVCQAIHYIQPVIILSLPTLLVPLKQDFSHNLIKIPESSYITVLMLLDQIIG